MNPLPVAGPVPAAPKSSLATASMVCGILSFFTCAGTSLPAVILGHIALSQIRNSGGTLDGRKQAKLGLWLGYGCFVVIFVGASLGGLLAPLIVRSQEKAHAVKYTTHLREISAGLTEYNKTQGTDTAPYPSDIRQLDNLGITTNIDELLTVRGRHAGDWLYFWAADSEDPSAPLLISPRLDRRKNESDASYLLLTTGGAVRTVEHYVVDAAVRGSRVPPEKVPAPVKN